jgi:hypothetical protein
MPTDTERLSWMLLHQPHFLGDDSGMHVIFWYGGKFHIAHGESKIECIDNAIAGKHKEVKEEE